MTLGLLHGGGGAGRPWREDKRARDPRDAGTQRTKETHGNRGTCGMRRELDESPRPVPPGVS